MGTITKPHTWSDGETITAALVNANEDVVINELNGSLTNTNLSGSAAIAQTKIDDISATDAAAQTTAAFGTGASPTKATTAQGEQQQIRRAIKRLSVGDAAELKDASNAQVTDFWQELRVVGPNLLSNAGFDVWDSTSETPKGWTQEGTAAYVNSEADAAEGGGRNLAFTSLANDDGISQTLDGDGLKASTRYLVGCRYKMTGAGGGGTLDILTEGALAAGNDYQDTTVNDTGITAATASTYTTASLVVQTDSTPTDLVFKVTLSAAGNTCELDNCFLYELGADPVGSTPAYMKREDRDATNTATVTESATPAWLDWPNLNSLQMQPPSPGYALRLTAQASLTLTNGTAGERAAVFRFHVTDGPNTHVLSSRQFFLAAQASSTASGSVMGMAFLDHGDLDPGSTWTCKLQVWQMDSGETTNIEANPSVSVSSDAGDDIDTDSWIVAELIHMDGGMDDADA